MTEYTKCISINKKDFFVESNEFLEIKNEVFSNLRILKDVDKYERIIGLVHELSKVKVTVTPVYTLLCVNVTHGGFVAINSIKHFK